LSVASYYNIVNHKLPLIINHCFVALFFIFCHGRNAIKGFVHNVVHAPILDYGQGFELSEFWVFFLGLNFLYYDGYVVKATTQFFLTIATLHDFHMSSSLCFLSHDLGH
jgi:hypothetical protein